MGPARPRPNTRARSPGCKGTTLVAEPSPTPRASPSPPPSRCSWIGLQARPGHGRGGGMTPARPARARPAGRRSRPIPGRLPRVLPAGSDPGWPAHVERWGPPPTGGPALIDEVERAGLRGRGGGGFPTAIKLRTVAAGRSQRRGGQRHRGRAGQHQGQGPAGGIAPPGPRRRQLRGRHGRRRDAIICMDAGPNPGPDRGPSRPGRAGAGRRRPGRFPAGGGSERLRGRRGIGAGALDLPGRRQTHLRAAPPLRTRRRRPPHPGQQRRDPGPPGPDRPVWSALVSGSRHR